MKYPTRAHLLLSTCLIYACDTGFEAEYIACDEFAGVGTVPLANVVDLVPADYTVIEPIPGQALVVAQSGSCDAIVAGGLSQPGIFAQFGVGVVPPLDPGNGDFYQLLFTTNHPKLAAHMHVAGVDARFSPQLSYTIDQTPQLSIEVPKPGALAFDLEGPITLPDPNSPANPTTVFNYYAQSPQGDNIQQQNIVDGIRFGTGPGVTLSAVGSEMFDIVGGAGVLMFPFFSNPETFDLATVIVTPNAF
ncbi:MAG: hypothetical protein K0V04_15280 [Deltaproteobacteria bacterium]|nr:hypothetical protein [Deltaproteobacteria bacterium]